MELAFALHQIIACWDKVDIANPVEAGVYTVTMDNPDDVSGVAALFDQGCVNPAHVIAVIAQTEAGDQARADAARALQRLLSARLGLSPDALTDAVPMLMIGGTAGLMCPHCTLFVNQPASTPGQPGVKRLVLTAGSTRVLMPEECGTLAQVREVARVVSKTMRVAGITDPADVQSVQLKTPVLTADQIYAAVQRGQRTCSPNPLTAAAMMRGAAALGAAVALGEVDFARLSDQAIGRDTSLYTRKAFASAGGEQTVVRVVLIGNADGAPGSLCAASGAMAHQLDVRGAQQVFAQAGLALADGMVAQQDQSRLKAVFVKAGADAVDHVLGRRHTIASDLLRAYAGHQAKAVAHAIVSSIAGDTLVLANAGPEHQGEPGSNLLCVIADSRCP